MSPPCGRRLTQGHYTLLYSTHPTDNHLSIPLRGIHELREQGEIGCPPNLDGLVGGGSGEKSGIGTEDTLEAVPFVSLIFGLEMRLSMTGSAHGRRQCPNVTHTLITITDLVAFFIL